MLVGLINTSGVSTQKRLHTYMYSDNHKTKQWARETLMSRTGMVIKRKIL